MGKEVKKLTAKEIDGIENPGKHRADNGLYLNVAKGGSKSWIFLYQLNNRRREMGLGGWPEISLPKARALALEARQKVANGIDPLAEKQAPAASLTFKEAATQFIAANKSGWRNEKHRGQWTATLATYAFSTIGPKSVAEIDVTDIRRILEPFWSVKNETATRVRQRIERILDWARVQGFRAGENPARWKGNLEHILPPTNRVKRVTHHPALPFAQLPQLMSALRQYRSVSAAALAFTILTCSRTGEVIGAQWSEIDPAKRIWTVPAERMKAGREHRVALTRPSLTILRLMKRIQVNDYVFPGGTGKGGLSNMALEMVLRGMNEPKLVWIDPTMNRPAVPHGFRSSFRDWASEMTSFPHEVCEMALAHAVGDKVEAAYRRGDLFEKRRALALTWTEFCLSARNSCI